jgi:6-pyruvoyl-tetrahydropterin synthase
MFHIIEYDEDNILDVSQYKDAVVKIKITNKKSQSKYDEFISSLDNSGLNDYSIIPESSLIVLDDSIPNIELETTINIIKHYIDELDDTIDKVSLTNLMTDVYHISLNQQGKL